METCPRYEENAVDTRKASFDGLFASLLDFCWTTLVFTPFQKRLVDITDPKPNSTLGLLERAIISLHCTSYIFMIVLRVIC